MEDLKIRINGEKAKVFAPYNKFFVQDIKNIGGARWNAEDHYWSVPISSLDAVRKSMRDYYGHDDRTGCELVKVRITFLDSDVALTEGISLCGKTIAVAFGRDSGARIGDDVVLVSGRVFSGGSAKNWTTNIEKGTVVEVSNVSRPIYDKYADGDWDEYYKFELIESSELEKENRKKALLEEKERLEQRLVEIEKEFLSLTSF